MKHYPQKVRKTLQTLIRDMSKTAWLYAKDPNRDFSRTRKLPFEKLLAMLISMGGGTLTKEILEYFKCSPETVSVSAFVQQREKLMPAALEFLFHEFTARCAKRSLYRGYRLLAVDGSDIQIPTNAEDPDSYNPGSSTQPAYNLLHLDAVYDLGTHLYEDMLVHGKRTYGENEALARMVDRSSIQDPVILIADRGYEAFNTMAHIEQKGWNYLIRIKDIAHKGIATGMALPTKPEFDVNIDYILTRKQTKKVKALMQEYPEQYHWLPSNVRFDLLAVHDSIFYPISFRIVRFPITDDSYEVVITNLPQDQFPAAELKKLYAMRWGVETSFRHLKYSLSLLNFHSKKTEYIVQEIFAKLIMYNFSEMITSHVIIQRKDRKYTYQANFSAAVLICRQFFRNAVSPSFMESTISKFIIPVRPGRSRPRFRSKDFQMRFFYRIA